MLIAKYSFHIIPAQAVAECSDIELNNFEGEISVVKVAFFSPNKVLKTFLDWP